MPTALLITIVFSFIFSITCVILGFVALLKQKVYVDPKTKKPTHVSVPFFGELTTNYPALVFVFAGMLGFWLMYRAVPADVDLEDYLITGRFVVDPASVPPGEKEKYAKVNFSNTTLVPFPNEVSDVRVDRNGTFSLTIKIPKESVFEDRVQRLTFSGHSSLIGSIVPSAVFNNKEVLKSHGPNLREYDFPVVPTLPLED